MYDPDVGEFKSSKSASAVEFEGIKSSEEEMKVEPTADLSQIQERFQGL